MIVFPDPPEGSGSNWHGSYDSGWVYVLTSYTTHTFQECVDGAVERAMAAASRPPMPSTPAVAAVVSGNSGCVNADPMAPEYPAYRECANRCVNDKIVAQLPSKPAAAYYWGATKPYTAKENARACLLLFASTHVVVGCAFPVQSPTPDRSARTHNTQQRTCSHSKGST
jgi:hypothetical protein